MGLPRVPMWMSRRSRWGGNAARGSMALTVLVMLTILASCALDPASEPDPLAAEATANAVEQAKQAKSRIDGDYYTKAEDYEHAAGQIEGVEVMAVKGTAMYQDGGVTLTIRVHGTATEVVRPSDGQSSQLSGDASPRTRTFRLPLCFLLEFSFATTANNGVEGPVTCPDTGPIVIEKDPVLPDDILTILKDALSKKAGSGTTETTVRQVVENLDLESGIRRDVAVRTGTVGVALRASRYDCAMARVTAGGVDTWRPRRIQLAPGELSCVASEAISGENIPH